MVTEANKKFYFKTISKDEVSECLTKAVNEKVSLFFWRKGDSEDDLEEFEPLEWLPNNQVLRLKLKTGFLKKLTGSKLAGGDVLFKMTFERFYLFSYGILEFNKEERYYEIKMKNSFYKSQQRQNFRLQASRTTKIQFKIDDEVFDGLDISAGGTSFNITVDDKDRFTKGAVYEKCLLRINSQKYEIPRTTIAGQWPNEDKKTKELTGYKVGVSFQGISEEVEEDLCQQINSQAREEVVRQTILRKGKKKSHA